MIGIYKITSPSGKSYIGQSINIEKRLRQYSNLDCKKQRYLYRAILKYGWENMNVEILYGVDKLPYKNFVLNLLEIRAIKSHNTMKPFGYNLKGGGDGKGFSDETRKLISEKLTGRKQSEETLAKLHKKRVLYKPSQETKDKISIKMTGRKLSDETRRKISDRMTGYKPSYETLQKMSISKTGTVQPEKFLLKIRKPILQYSKSGEFIAEFKSIKIASDITGVHKGNISSCACNDPRRGRYAGGFLWKHKELITNKTDSYAPVLS